MSPEAEVRAIILFMALATAACAQAMAADQCPTQVDRTQLELDYPAFDAAGWRDLLGRGCADAAVAQLMAYREASASRISPDQMRELDFHVGQTLAMSGRDAESIPHFERARGGDEEWAAYVEATLAFLKRDAAALAAQRARYAAAQSASPMRLQFIDGFIACLDRSYMEAAHCGMAH